MKDAYTIEEVEAEVQKWHARIVRLLPPVLGPRPHGRRRTKLYSLGDDIEVRFTGTRPRRKIAHGGQRGVCFNFWYMRAVPRDVYHHTVVHEVCHTIACRIEPCESHGTLWEFIMRIAGYQPSRTANYSQFSPRAEQQDETSRRMWKLYQLRQKLAKLEEVERVAAETLPDDE